MGYGIRYEYGMFKQAIENGFQKEHPDHWLVLGNPWGVRHEYTAEISFGGHTEFYNDRDGKARVRWVAGETVLAIPYDMPIPGFHNGTVNTLRLWKSAATESFNLNEFNAGDYAAVTAKNTAENISMVLYPNDKSENGKELRLRQQYFSPRLVCKTSFAVGANNTAMIFQSLPRKMSVSSTTRTQRSASRN